MKLGYRLNREFRNKMNCKYRTNNGHRRGFWNRCTTSNRYRIDKDTSPNY